VVNVSDQISQREREVQEAIETVRSQRVEAAKIAREGIPQRRFGSGVTKSIQSQAQARKNEANKLVKDLNTREQQLFKNRESLRRQREGVEEEERLETDIEVAERVAGGGSAFGLTTRQRRLLFQIQGDPALRQQRRQREALQFQQGAAEGGISGAVASAPEGGVLVDTGSPDIHDQQRIVLTPVQGDIQGNIIIPQNETMLDKREFIGVVAAVEQPTGALERAEAKVRQFESKIATRQLRGEQLTVLEKGGQFGAAGALAGIGTVKFVTDISQTFLKDPFILGKKAKQFIQSDVDPFLLGKQALEKGRPDLGQLAREKPLFFTGAIAGQLAITFGAGKVVTKGVDFGEAVLARTSRKFIPLTETGAGKQVLAGIPSQAGGTFDLPVAPTLSKLDLSLAKQAGLAGTKQTIVSTQTSFFGRIKTTLKGSKTLERDLFFDPLGRARISRLGGKEASTLDIFSGDFKIGGLGKQEILIKESAQIEKFPSALKDIQKALKGRGTLSPQQLKRLTAFQRTPSGKVKPIGFISKEPEVILPAGEVVKARKVIGKSIIRGRATNIIRIEFGKPSPAIQKVLKKPGLSKAELNQLQKGSKTSSAGGRPILRPSKLSGLAPRRATKSFTSPKSLTSNLGFSKRISGLSKRPASKITSKPSPTRRTPNLLSPIIPRRRPPTGGSSTLIPRGGTPTFARFPLALPKALGKVPKTKKKGRGVERLFLTPSLAARALNIRKVLGERQASRVARRGFTGLETRPIFLRRKRKAKRR